MSEIQPRFLRSTTAMASVEYALIAMSLALVVVLAVGAAGVDLRACYNHVAAALP